MTERNRPFPLEYESVGLQRRNNVTFFRVVGWAVPKLFFAAGLSVLAGGLGDSIRGQYYSGPNEMMIGAFMAGIVVPVVRWRRREES